MLVDKIGQAIVGGETEGERLRQRAAEFVFQSGGIGLQTIEDIGTQRPRQRHAVFLPAAMWLCETRIGVNVLPRVVVLATAGEVRFGAQRLLQGFLDDRRRKYQRGVSLRVAEPDLLWVGVGRNQDALAFVGRATHADDPEFRIGIERQHHALLHALLRSEPGDDAGFNLQRQAGVGREFHLGVDEVGAVGGGRHVAVATPLDPGHQPPAAVGDEHQKTRDRTLVAAFLFRLREFVETTACLGGVGIVNHVERDALAVGCLQIQVLRHRRAFDRLVEGDEDHRMGRRFPGLEVVMGNARALGDELVLHRLRQRAAVLGLDAGSHGDAIARRWAQRALLTELAGERGGVKPAPLATRIGLHADGNLGGGALHAPDRYHRAVELKDDLATGGNVVAVRRDAQQRQRFFIGIDRGRVEGGVGGINKTGAGQCGGNPCTHGFSPWGIIMICRDTLLLPGANPGGGRPGVGRRTISGGRQPAGEQRLR